jgi:hypothetical protein
MVNPLLTIVFDVFLIGSALAIASALVEEARARRVPAVGLERPCVRRTRLVRHASVAPRDHRREVAAMAASRRRRLAA